MRYVRHDEIIRQHRYSLYGYTTIYIVVTYYIILHHRLSSNIAGL